jgi:Putative transposase
MPQSVKPCVNILRQYLPVGPGSWPMFFGVHPSLTCAKAFATFLAPQRKKRWFVYAKEPFAGPKAVLAYLSRYTHRVAISNSRLIKTDASGMTFSVKYYRADGDARYTTITLAPAEFIRRVLLHVLPKGFHRIHLTGVLAGSGKANNIEVARALLAVLSETKPNSDVAETEASAAVPTRTCPCCDGAMHEIEPSSAVRRPVTALSPRGASSRSTRHDHAAAVAKRR